MKTPWPRRLVALSGFTVLFILGAVLFRAPWPADDFKDLRDSVGDHGSMLSAGHASLGTGASSCVYCHLPHQAKSMRPLWLKEGNHDSTAFGRESMQAGGVQTDLCMSCHDGTVAPALRAHYGSSGSKAHQSGASANHPVGVDYLSVFRLKPDSYNDPTLNPKIILEGGKVGCVSCHATHDPSVVSAGNIRQEVCTECHRR